MYLEARKEVTTWSSLNAHVSKLLAHWPIETKAMNIHDERAAVLLGPVGKKKKRRAVEMW